MGHNKPHRTTRHPIVEQQHLIEERGLQVFENITRMPVYYEAFALPHLVIGLNHQGYVRAEYDMQPVEFHPHDISIVYPGHIVMATESSDDYRATLVVISQGFLNELRYRTIRRYQLEYLRHASFRLNDWQYDSIVHSIQLLKTISELDTPLRLEMLAKQVDVFSQLVDLYRFGDAEMSSPQNKNEQLFHLFYDNIVAHYQEAHEVKFYADKLCLSPKYFANLIKQTTGISASTWIAKYIIIQARAMMRQKQMNIQQISEQLGFSEQSSFTRYFKQHTGITPSKYKAML